MKKNETQIPPTTLMTRIAVSAFVLIGLIIASTIIAAIMANDNDLADANTAHITVSGVIVTDGDDGIWGGGMASSTEIVRELEKARDDDRIQAVLLEINSPGGSPVASDEIAQAVKSVRAANKTVVAWIREEGASGGYWVASAADHIVAHRMSVTGSIGVYGSYLQFDEFIDDWNVSYNRLVSGERKDIGDPFVNLDDGRKEFLQRKLDKLHGFFVEEVATNRNISVETIEAIADGGILLGVEAKEEGLVDELGGKPEAIAFIEERIGEEASIVEYAPERTFFEELFGIVAPARQPTLQDLASKRAIESSGAQFSLR